MTEFYGHEAPSETTAEVRCHNYAEELSALVEVLCYDSAAPFQGEPRTGAGEVVTLSSDGNQLAIKIHPTDVDVGLILKFDAAASSLDAHNFEGKLESEGTSVTKDENGETLWREAYLRANRAVTQELRGH